MIVDVIADQPPEMLLVQRDNVVEDLAAATANPALRQTILPWRLDAGLLGFQTGGLQKLDHITIELRVPVQNYITVRASVGKGLTQLLNDPLRSRVTRDVEVQDLPASMLDDEETVQQPKGHCRHREEVQSHDDFAVILEKRQPVLRRITAAANASQISGEGPFRDDEAKFEKLTVDLRCAPTGIFFRQASDQGADLLGDLRPAAAQVGPPTPVQPKTGAVPTDDSLRLHDDQDLGPAGPDAAESGPEEPVQGVQRWPRPLALEHGELLSEGEDLEGGLASTADEDAHSSQDRKGELEHEATLITWRNRSWDNAHPERKLLIS